MPPSSGELWGHSVMPSSVIVDCLLPNGIIIPLPCMRDAPLNLIKGNDVLRVLKAVMANPFSCGKFQ